MRPPLGPIAKSSSRSSKSRAHGLVTLARIGRAHGLRGGFTIEIDPSVLDVVRAGLRCHALTGDDDVSLEIVSVGRSGGRLVVTAAGIDSREAAEALRGARLLVAASELPPLAESEYYDFEILGAEVVDPSGERIGTVVEILDTGANDVYVLRTPDRGEALVPAAAHAVLRIDKGEKRIVVDPSTLSYQRDEA